MISHAGQDGIPTAFVVDKAVTAGALLKAARGAEKALIKDVAVFDGEAGPDWVDGGGRRRNWPDWKDWLGKRAQSGRMGPRGLRKFR